MQRSRPPGWRVPKGALAGWSKLVGRFGPGSKGEGRLAGRGGHISVKVRRTASSTEVCIVSYPIVGRFSQIARIVLHRLAIWRIQSCCIILPELFQISIASHHIADFVNLIVSHLSIRLRAMIWSKQGASRLFLHMSTKRVLPVPESLKSRSLGSTASFNSVPMRAITTGMRYSHTHCRGPPKFRNGHILLNICLLHCATVFASVILGNGVAGTGKCGLALSTSATPILYFQWPDPIAHRSVSSN
jgi:hypothetical protein